MRRPSEANLVSLMSWAGRLGASATDSFALAAVRENEAQVLERGEDRAIQEELLKLPEGLVGEQKQDLHRERSPLTPEGLFDQICRAVLVRDGLDQSLQDWRALRLEAVAHDAQAAAADGDEADEGA